MKLADAIRAVQTDLPITVRHEKWLASHSNATYSAEAVAFAQRQLAGEYQNRPRMRFRSSSTGFCDRRRVFAALGIKEPEFIDSKLANIFHTGNYLHLKWQMAGLTEGWLKEVEVPADNPDIMFGGTLDGIIDDGSGFEFKSCNSRSYATVWQGPKEIHIRQVHAYMYLRPDIEKFSVVYENKDTQEWREYRVLKDPKLIKAIDREVGHLNAAMDQQKLPPVLDECATRNSATYRGCPFHEMCLKQKKWPLVMNGNVV